MACWSLSRFSMISKGTCFTVLLVAVALLNSNTVESSRNMNITAEGNFPDLIILGVWNDSFKAVENCSRFHYENFSEYFFFWPEPDFKFCCGWLRNYTYTTYGPPLELTSYFDIGPVDTCLPYWKCPKLSNWDKLTEYVTFFSYCEMGDMQTFYSKRLVRVIWLNGIVQTALPCVVILEFGVFLAIVALSSSGSWKSASAQSRGWSQVLSLLCRKNYANIIANLVHLCLLVVIGNCFMEATGHSDAYGWESGMFLKWAQYYLLAPSILAVAIFCQQTADWGAAWNSIKDEDDARDEGDVPNTHAVPKAKCAERTRRNSNVIRAPHEPRRCCDVGHGSDGGNNQKSMLFNRGNAKDVVTVPNEDDVAKRFVSVSEDWRWQPVFGQTMVLVLIGFYCTYNSDDHRTEFVNFVLGVAVVFCTWSGIITCAILLRSVKCLHQNLRLSRPSKPSPQPIFPLQAITSEQPQTHLYEGHEAAKMLEISTSEQLRNKGGQG